MEKLAINVMASDKIRTNRVTQIVHAKRIQKSLGTKVAARYLAIRGWSIEAARYILLGV